MIFEQIRIGADRNFAYLIADEQSREAAIVDPAFDQPKVLAALASRDLELLYVVNTHGHGDHSGGNAVMAESTGAKVVAHPLGRDPDIAMGDGDELAVGSLTLRFIHTPGHTEDCLCILVEDKLITGDTLFVGKVGGCFGAEAEVEYHSLHDKLMTLPEGIEVWPGHDYGTAPSSTIGNEKRTNPFILRESLEDFVWLKENWAQYKREHGIA